MSPWNVYADKPRVTPDDGRSIVKKRCSYDLRVYDSKSNSLSIYDLDRIEKDDDRDHENRSPFNINIDES